MIIVEYLEILLSNVNACNIDMILENEFKITNKVVISSHFYDNINMIDMQYYEIIDFASYYSSPNTGNIFVKELYLKETLFEVIIVMSFEDELGDITLNFRECSFIIDDIDCLKVKVFNIVSKLLEIQKKYSIGEIRIGYESVIDVDNVILSIANGNVTVVNKFQGQLANAIKITYY